MPQVNKAITLFLLILMSQLLTVGCSNPNSQSQFSADGQGHAADWLPAGHMTAAKADESSCAECHGSDFAGGISGVSCTQCHLGGVDSVHPEAWSGVTGTAHAAYVAANGNTACANINCHGTALSGVAGSGPSCTLCHLGGIGSMHPQDWGDLAYYKHSLYVNANGTDSCSNANCHGSTLAGVAGSGPSCTSCHLGGVNSIHPTAWAADITLHKNYVAAMGSSSCANTVCHGVALQGVFLSGPSCAQCH
ncbi:MAG TPA: hypothetical protein VL087_03170 [Nitrospirota bacterium]|nr:hypothetical protein [Nitrospirota bacterium]